MIVKTQIDIYLEPLSKFLVFVLIVFLLLCYKNSVVAQTEAMYSQYLYNKLVLNPAYAGSREGICFFAAYRNQWNEIEGAPQSVLGSFHTLSRNKKYGIGVNLFNDQLSIFNSYAFNANFAYRFFIGKNVLALGINAGVFYTQSESGKLTTFQQGDVSTYIEMRNGKVLPNVGSGIYLKNKRMAVGISIPQIINNNMLKNNDVPLDNHFYFTFDYLFNVGKQYTLEGQKLSIVPSLLLKFVPRTNFQVDFNLNLVLYSALWLGAGYRSDNSYIFSAQYALNKFIKNSSTSFRIGYSYDLAAKSYRANSAGAHEIILMMDLSKNKNKILSPRLF